MFYKLESTCTYTQIKSKFTASHESQNKDTRERKTSFFWADRTTWPQARKDKRKEDLMEICCWVNSWNLGSQKDKQTARSKIKERLQKKGQGKGQQCEIFDPRRDQLLLSTFGWIFLTDNLDKQYFSRWGRKAFHFATRKQQLNKIIDTTRDH